VIIARSVKAHHSDLFPFAEIHLEQVEALAPFLFIGSA